MDAGSKASGFGLEQVLVMRSFAPRCGGQKLARRVADAKDAGFEVWSRRSSWR